MAEKLTTLLSKALIIPCLIVFYFSFTQGHVAVKAILDSEKVVNTTKVVNGITNLVHELQKERSLSERYLISQGNQFSLQLPEQQIQTEVKLKALKQLNAQHLLDNRAASALLEIMPLLESREDMIERIDQLSITELQVRQYYDTVNKALLELNYEMAKSTAHNTMSRQMMALQAYSLAKEIASMERAVLANVFSSGSLTGKLREEYLQLLTSEKNLLSTAQYYADKQFDRILRRQMISPQQQQVEVYREIAKQDRAGFNVTMAQWLRTANNRLAVYKTNEQILLNQITDTAESMYVNGVLLLGIFSLLGIITIAAIYALYIGFREAEELLDSSQQAEQVKANRKSRFNPFTQAANQKYYREQPVPQGVSALEVQALKKRLREAQHNHIANQQKQSKVEQIAQG